MAQAIIDEPERLKDILGKTSKPKQFGQGEFTVQVVPDGDNITLVSTGKFKGGNVSLHSQCFKTMLDPNFKRPYLLQEKVLYLTPPSNYREQQL